MSEAESVHFVRYMSRSRKKDRTSFITFFRIAKENPDQDEKELKKRMLNTAFGKKFSFYKSELLDYICQSLLNQRVSQSTDHDIHSLIELSELLSQKSLYKLALKKLNRAHDIALQYDKHFALLDILDKQRKLLKQIPTTTLRKQLDENTLEKKQVIEKIENEDTYAELNDKVYLVYRQQYAARDKGNLAELESIMQCPALKNEEQAITFLSKFRYHAIYAFYNSFKSEFGIALKHRSKIISLWENNPHLIPEYPQRYSADLANLLSARYNTGSFKDFDEIIKKIEALNKGTAEDNAFEFRELYRLKQLFLLNTGRLNEAYQLVSEIADGLQNYGEQINEVRKHSFWFNNAVTCFLLEKYEEAIPWVNHLLNPAVDKTVRNDLRDFASILEIILYYETGKYNLEEVKLRNTRDRLTYKNKLFPFEKVVLDNIAKLIKAKGDQSKTAKVLKHFAAELKELETNKLSPKLTGLEEISIWLNKKANL